MEKNVRQKLHDIDHLLDSEYETVKVKFVVDEVKGDMGGRDERTEEAKAVQE